MRGQENASFAPLRSHREKLSLLQETFPSLSLYEVGGSIRDKTLGEEAKDIDVCVVGETPDTLMQTLSSAGKVEALSVAGKIIGGRLRTSFAPEGIEITLARKESSTGPGHSDFSFYCHPETTIEEDLARRDFTCNAIARNLKTDLLVDPFGGMGDIQEKLLRETSDNILREDPLRVLRGLRLMAEYDFYPDKKTSDSMKKASSGISNLSGERIMLELRRIILSEEGESALSFALNQGWYTEIFPELEDNISFDQQSPHHSLPVDRHGLSTLKSARRLTDKEEILWAALLHDSGKPESGWMGDDGRLHYYADPKRPGTRSHEDIGSEKARLLLNRLHAPKRLIKETAYLIKEHMYFDDRSFSKRSDEDKARRARRFLAKHGRSRAEKLLLLRLADLGGKDAGDERIKDARRFAQEVRRAREITFQDLAIDGRDLLSLGASGREVGEILTEIKSRIIDNPHLNEKKRLLTWAKRIIEE